jgi:hypothetical protein
MVTREQVIEEAKKLGLTLTDAQIDAHVTLGRLPEKAAGSSSGDKSEEDDADGEKDLTAGMKERLRKEKEKRSKLEKDMAETAKKLKEFEDANAAKSRSDAEKKGEYDKLIQEANDAKARFESGSKAFSDRYKEHAIQGEVKTALLAAGVPKDRLPKAIKLFDISKVDFEFTDEAKLEYEVDGLDALVEEFQKDNDFLFTGTGNENDDTNFIPQTRRPKPGLPKPDKAKEDLKKRHPRLFN